jgi:acyl-coenzyme A thioesterase PaaI-like protein
MCFVCGKDNPHGFRLQFEHPHKGLLKATVVFSKHHQGYKNIVHGGMIATVLDEMMVNLAWKEGTPVVTGEIKVRLKKAAVIGEKVFLEGRIEREEGRIVYASSTATNEKGEVLATAKASCLRIRPLAQ